MDKGRTGNHFIPINPTANIYYDSATGANKPCISSAGDGGINQSFGVDGWAYTSSIFIVFQSRGLSNSGTLYQKLYGGHPLPLQRYKNICIVASSGGFDPIFTSFNVFTAQTTPQILENSFDKAGNVFYEFRNGTSTGSRGMAYFGDSAGVFNIGNTQPVYFCEILIYNKSMGTNSVERQQVEGYLAWKWGIQTQLPSGHPYLSAPPSYTPTPA
jgi:hypothetical protein